MGYFFDLGPLEGAKIVPKEVFGQTDSIGIFFMNICRGFNIFFNGGGGGGGGVKNDQIFHSFKSLGTSACISLSPVPWEA